MIRLDPAAPTAELPLFGDFAERWAASCAPQWKPSYRETVACTLRRWLLPALAHWPLARIDREAILQFRAAVRTEAPALSPARVNKIVSILGACLAEASRRYRLDNPAAGIRPLRVERVDIQPFSLPEIDRIVASAGPYADYYCVRFFTGLRTGEIDGLQWRYVDLERGQVLVRETVVKARRDTPKTVSSARDVDLVPRALDALRRQHARTGSADGYVFCARNGAPLRHGNMRRRVWLPLLARVGLAPRRQYETRHTYATLMLAAGENPEYVRAQLGHRNTEMLFSVYSRYVRNLTRQDGSAFARLVQGATPPSDGPARTTSAHGASSTGST